MLPLKSSLLIALSTQDDYLLLIGCGSIMMGDAGGMCDVCAGPVVVVVAVVAAG